MHLKQGTWVSVHFKDFWIGLGKCGTHHYVQASDIMFTCVSGVQHAINMLSTDFFSHAG